MIILSKENFKFFDLMLIEENDKEEIYQIKREILNRTEFAQPAILLHSYLNYKKFLKVKNSKRRKFLTIKKLIFSDLHKDILFH